MTFAAPSHASILSLEPDSVAVTVGEEFTVDVVVNTQGVVIDGVDINALNFDPALLEVVDAHPERDGIQIGAGSLMASTMTNRVEQEKGKIYFSQITGDNATFTSTKPDVLATITFIPRETGTVDMFFDYTAGSTTDTNIAAVGSDVLVGVNGATYTINGRSSDTFLNRLLEWVRGIFG